MLPVVCFALAFVAKPVTQIPSKDFVRDAEIKHGRVALLALPTLAALSLVDPDPVTLLSRQDAGTQLTFFATSGLVEALSLSRLGSNFTLRDGVTPGNFPPLRASPAFQDAEDVAGKAAMLATTVWLISSLF